jgi:hypothetical protein
MKTIDTTTFEFFKRQFTNGAGRRDWTFFKLFGDITFEEAYPMYLERNAKIDSRRRKIEAFETYLQSLGIIADQSNLSESRYYNYGGKCYRFSGHVHPSGSLTTDITVDFSANPELIDDINF